MSTFAPDVPPRAAPTTPTTPARHVLSILDLTPAQIGDVCRRALAIKQASADPRTLRGRTVGVYFRKPSTRTRTSFLAAAGRLGATVVALGAGDLQTTTGETLEDTARVLAGYLDVLVMRTNESVEEMKVFAACPGLSVINALSADQHPTQALADFTTLLEHFGHLEGLTLVYYGEGNKTAATLALAVSGVPGMRLTIAAPAGYGLDARTLSVARTRAAAHGAAIEQTHDAADVPTEVDVVYTSRWQEMGVVKSPPDWRTRFLPFRVSAESFARLSGARTVFLHDLPAVRGEEVDADVLDGPRSLAWLQARNKLFSAMSVMEWCQQGVSNDASWL